MIVANRGVSVLRTGEPKIVRHTSRTCRPSPICAVSPSDAVPETSVERSITVLSTLPRFDSTGSAFPGGDSSRSGDGCEDHANEKVYVFPSRLGFIPPLGW